MGQSQSQTLGNYVTNNDTFKTAISQTFSTSSYVQTTDLTNADINVILGNVVACGCNSLTNIDVEELCVAMVANSHVGNISSNSSITGKVVTHVDGNISSNISTSLVSSLQNDFATKLSQANQQGLILPNFLSKQNQTSINDINNNISSSITENFSDSVMTSISEQYTANANTSVLVCGGEVDNITADATLDQIVNATLLHAADALSNNQTVANAYTALSTVFSQASTNSWVTIIIGIVVAIVVVIGFIVLFVIYEFSGGSSPTPGQVYPGYGQGYPSAGYPSGYSGTGYASYPQYSAYY